MSQAACYTAEQKSIIRRDHARGFVGMVEFYHDAETFHPVFTYESYLTTAQALGYWCWVEACIAHVVLMPPAEANAAE